MGRLTARGWAPVVAAVAIAVAVIAVVFAVVVLATANESPSAEPERDTSTERPAAKANPLQLPSRPASPQPSSPSVSTPPEADVEPIDGEHRPVEVPTAEAARPPAVNAPPAAQPAPKPAPVCPIGPVGWSFVSVEFPESERNVLKNLGTGVEYDTRVTVAISNASNWPVEIRTLSTPVTVYKQGNPAQRDVPVTFSNIRLAAGETVTRTGGWANSVGVTDSESFSQQWEPARITYPSSFTWVDPDPECGFPGTQTVLFVP